MSSNPFRFQMAIEDFQWARQRAALQEILARFTGRSNDLLSYEDVEEKLRLRVRAERGIQQIPLDAIVGSVGRYTEFTRTFLPRRIEDQQRWARVKAAMQEGQTMPVIEVYKVGEAYFVADGNHRVSIARQEGLDSIEAHVIEFKTPVSFTPDMQLEDVISQAEYAEFLAATRIHEARPNVDLSVTTCCQYDKLMEQIAASQRSLGDNTDPDQPAAVAAPLEDAALSWYDKVYTPLAEAIRDRDLLHWFPGRTITDLYIWISENRTALEAELGWDIQSDIAATDLIMKGRSGTETGNWRKARTVARYTDRLFMDILVPLSGDEESWDSLAQALLIAQREGARLHGLHVVGSEDAIAGSRALAVQARFHEECAHAGVDGRLAIEAGHVASKIRERAPMADLIVLKVAHPPTGAWNTLRSPVHSIIREASRPVLGVPAAASHLGRALLAYDGSELSREALFVGAYLAEVWKSELLVFTALEGSKLQAGAQDYARRYLELHEVSAEYVVSDQDAQQALKRVAEEWSADLVLMGSHGKGLVRQVLIGSALDYMLRESRTPIFICR